MCTCVLVKARIHAEADQAVWTILQQSIARALEYDMRLCPWQYLESHAERLKDECFKSLELLLGRELDEQARQQAMLPGALGGLTLSLPKKRKG